MVIFRIAEKGLEVFLIRDEQAEIREQLVEISEKMIDELPLSFTQKDDFIELQTLQTEHGEIRAIAIESVAYDNLSLRQLIKDDLYQVKNKIKHLMLSSEEGNFVSFKDAIKSTMRIESKLIKELKDIISDRNQTNNI